MGKNILCCLLIGIFGSTYGFGQTRTDTSGHSPVRTLSMQQYNAYLKGEADDDMAMVAEQNHYPMPDKVLKFGNELKLTPVQIQKITDINTLMHRRRLQVGQSIVNNEKTLDSLFKYKKVNDGNLVFYTNRFGLYQGELKNAMLQACWATQQLLSAQQLKKYESLQKK